ncbi:MAG TPA: YibE/F family protein [Patescibacteria group bacterium]|nr:YibE/F family protein [Patescibacteria group bacterium]
MGRLKRIFFSLFLFILIFSPRAFAQSPSVKEEYSKAQIVSVVDSGKVVSSGQTNYYQDLKVKILSGSEENKTLNIHIGDPDTLTLDHEVSEGDTVVLLRQTMNGKTVYSVYDKYRSMNIFIILAVFVVMLLIVTGVAGLGSLLGLLISLSVILFFIVPNILNGVSPLVVTLVGAVIILIISTYVAHGISKKTSVALASTFISLLIATVIAMLFTDFATLTGVGNEDIAQLAIGATKIINLKGLFLSGIIIGTLGALNDVTISQSATIFELAEAHEKIKAYDLFKKGFNVGREHILSLVNTLVLAYAGSSLFIFIFLVLNPGKVPYWVIFNTETISGEIVSTVAGSLGLILAVPIVTFIASMVAVEFKRSRQPTKKD